MSDKRAYLFAQFYINQFHFLLLCFYVHATDKQAALRYSKHSPKMGEKMTYDPTIFMVMYLAFDRHTPIN